MNIIDVNDINPNNYFILTYKKDIDIKQYNCCYHYIPHDYFGNLFIDQLFSVLNTSFKWKAYGGVLKGKFKQKASSDDPIMDLIKNSYNFVKYMRGEKVLLFKIELLYIDDCSYNDIRNMLYDYKMLDY